MYLVVKKIRNVRYLYLMEPKYDKATRKIKKYIVESFGNYDNFVKENPERYADLQEKYGTSKEKYKTEKEQTINNFFNQLGATSPEFLSKLKCLLPQGYAYLLLRKLWNDELSLSKYFNYLVDHEEMEIKYNISDIALYFSMLKNTSPKSYLAGLEESPRYLGDPMS